jgi:hypothetical protein
MKLYLRVISAAALAVAISVAVQRSAEIVLAASQSGPINTEQGQTPDNAGPTLKETTDWLKTNLEGYGGGCWNSGGEMPSSEEKISDVSIDSSCRLSYKTSLVHSNGKAFHQQLISIPLGAVSDIQLGSVSSPGTGCADNWQIVVKTGNIVGGATIDINREPSVVAGTIVPPTPTQMAPRIQKAIQRAVDLCRGTYKAPPSAKEPF